MRGIVGLVLLLCATPALALTVRLEWGPPATGTPDGYSIYRRVATGQYELTGTLPASSLTYTDNNVGLGQTCWHVTAYNAGGESPPSNEVCFFAPTAPGSPVNLRIIP